MRKIYSFLIALLAVCGMAQAQVVFDFSTDNAYELFGFTGFSSSDDNFGDFTEDGSVTSGDVTITVSPSGGKNANRMWNGSLRMYGGTMTIVSKGEKITSINFVINSSKWGEANSANVGTLTKGEWAGEAEEVVITIAANTQLKSMTVNLGGETPVPTPTIDWTSTAEAPLSVAAVLEKAAQLKGGEASDKEVYVKGQIAAITEIGTVNATTGEPYGNATYTIVDNPAVDGQSLVVFRGFGLDGAKLAEGDIKEGDEVVVVGIIKNYVDKEGVATIEVDKGNKIYSLNGETGGGDTPTPQPTEGERGDGSLENPFNYLAAAKAASALEAGAKSEQDYYIAGRISEIKYTFSAQYGTATFFISDNGQTENQFQVYGAYYLGNRAWVDGDTQIAVGDTVIICGKIMNYKGTTPETVSKENFIYSLNGVTDGGNPDPQPTIDWTSSAEAPLTVAALIEKASQLAAGAKSNVEVFVKGIVSEMVDMSVEYGNATYYISDDGQTENQFYVYRGKGLQGENFTATDTLKVGDEVIVVGYVTNFVKDEVSTLEFASGSKLYSLNGLTEKEPEPYETEGAGLLDDPYTIADIQHIGNVKENGTTGWVMGYIVGYADGSMKNSVFGIEAPEGKEVLDTNILLAASADETDAANCIPVQLSKQFDMREVLSLKAVPENLGKKLWIQGEFITYFSVPGVKNVTDWSFDGETITTNVNNVRNATANQTIYNLAGQRVKTINRSGLYIVGGKKVVVK